MTIGTNYSYGYYDPTKYASNNPEIAQSYLTNTVQTTSCNNDAFVSNSDGCTDGKDDGKIGFFGAIGNAIKGVGKTIVNGVKGMFTNKEGKFSLGKTLLSIGTAALCIAVPAVGVAACVVGGVMGAVQIGKGAVKAANAQTDAEAKAAWQDMGGGAFTVAASVVGAKAGVKAVKSTSTATNGLASLGKNATTGQKAAALGRDMISSTKNRVGSLKSSATSYYNAGKIKYTEAKAAKIDATKTGLTPDELHAINDAKYQRLFASDDTLAALDKIDDVSNTVTGLKNKANGYKGAAEVKYAEAKAAKIDTSTALTPDELHTIKNAEYQRLFASDDTLAALDKVDDASAFVSNAKTKITNGSKAKISDVKTNLAKEFKHPIKSLKNHWDANISKIKGLDKKSISNVTSKLSQPAKKAWAEISTGKYSYPEAVSKFGYENVAEVLKLTAGVVIPEDQVI